MERVPCPGWVVAVCDGAERCGGCASGDGAVLLVSPLLLWRSPLSRFEARCFVLRTLCLYACAMHGMNCASAAVGMETRALLRAHRANAMYACRTRCTHWKGYAYIHRGCVHVTVQC